MKRLITFIFLLFISTLISASSGCTKIDVPIDKKQDSSIMIIADKLTILDTEPVIIRLENAEGPISWSINTPFLGGYIVPPDGVKVVFNPPNVNKKSRIELKATDKDGNNATIIIDVLDEGNPPEPGEIIINEIAWAGTLKSSYDEYIEILNITERDFYLNNWKIENAGGNGIAITFSGYLKAKTPFLIANYQYDIEKSSITASHDFATSKLALSNNCFGPYILENFEGEIFNEVGNGGSYPYGINSSNIRASMARFNDGRTISINWDPSDWYTEGVSNNLSDGTFGTPGEINSNIEYGINQNEDMAKGIIVKYIIDANDEVGEDWAQILITKDGDIKNFILTDLDGSDNPITNNDSVLMKKGDLVTVIWGDSYSIVGNRYTIPDTNPTGTKDELVLLCSGKFLDGLCYYSTDEVQFDDKDKIKSYGWTGDPIHSKYGERKMVDDNYITDLSAYSWDTDNKPLP
ncbi:MAG: hypothetical protein DRP84_01675 [Spirochaetes bacterium]|nr:MAG: hypothetical protein DRP84_01675 [Spirochaetota bacterium]